MRTLHNATCLIALLLGATLMAPPAWTAARELGPNHWTGVPRVVAFGDVHGAYDQMVTALKSAGVVDADLDWAAGETHLVSLGDLLDRGAHSRQTMDLLMRLQRQAAATSR